MRAWHVQNPPLNGTLHCKGKGQDGGAGKGCIGSTTESASQKVRTSQGHTGIHATDNVVDKPIGIPFAHKPG